MTHRGYSDTFEACATQASQVELHARFPEFREMFDVYHFLLPVGEQIYEPDKEALSLAMSVNPKLCFDYMSVEKPSLGYRDKTNIPRWDMVDSRHIMMSTILFDTIGTAVGNVVEIGGGWGNWVRLNEIVIKFNCWSIIDLPFVTELQWWYLEKTVSQLTHVFLYNSDEYQKAKNQMDDLVNIDVVLGAHSLSEFSMDVFDDYFENVVLKSKYLFYSTHLWLPDKNLVDQKLAKIGQHFRRVRSVISEKGMVDNIVYERI